MPVKAAVEDRMQGARTVHVLRSGHHVVELVGVLPLDVAERNAREAGRCLGGQPGHRNTRKYIKAMLPTSMSSAVGTCTLMTA